MATNLQVCDICPTVTEKVKKLRFRKEKTKAAIILKIDKEKQMVVLDEEYEDIEIDDLVTELPASQPRYLLLSYVYKCDDGRMTYPLCFIFITPQGSAPDLMMMYAGTKQALVRQTEITKVFEIRSLEDLTEDFLNEKMAFFT